ncbi:hypothetical protein B7463_g6490, partial [Scytalidium lignicola]
MLRLIKYLSTIFSIVTIALSLSDIDQDQLDKRWEITTPLLLKIDVIHQFPQPTWIENLAVRSNSGGDILCTVLTASALYLIKPSTGEATLLHSFPVTAVLGITQLEHDIFYVSGGNFSTTTGANTPGSYIVFRVDIRGYDRHGVAGIQVTEVVNIAQSILFNGMTRLSSLSKTLLVADSMKGYVWEIDAETGAYTYISLPEMLPPSGQENGVGINGVRTKNGYLYWTNTASGTLHRVAIDPIFGKVIGPVEELATGIVPDDFVIGDHGYIWICQNFLNTLSVLLPNGTVVDVAGSPDSLLVAGPTSCGFGWDDKLYCSTTGGLKSAVNGTKIGGEIFEIDTKGFKL